MDDAPALTLVSRVMHDLRTVIRADRHEVHELLLIEQGLYRCRLAGGTLEARPGQAAVHPAGTVHRPSMPPDSTVRFLVVQWRGACPWPAGTVVDDPARRLLLLGQWMLDLVPQAADTTTAPLLGHILATLLAATARLAAGASDGDHPVERARAFLLANLGYPLRRVDLCRICRLSPSRLNEVFVAVTGQAPMRWLRRQRCERARALLTTTDLPAVAVARACGLGNAAYLSRTLRAELGLTPRQLRRPGPKRDPD